MRLLLDDKPCREVGRARDVEDVGFAFRRFTDRRVFECERITAEGRREHPQGQTNEILLHRVEALLRRRRRSTASGLRRRKLEQGIAVETLGRWIGVLRGYCAEPAPYGIDVALVAVRADEVAGLIERDGLAALPPEALLLPLGPKLPAAPPGPAR